MAAVSTMIIFLTRNMTDGTQVSTCAPPPSFAWRSLVERSILSWNTLKFARANSIYGMTASMTKILQSFPTIDHFLIEPVELTAIFWFFQRKEVFLAQNTMRKWSRDHLGDYILLPAARTFASRQDCFFVSHYWCDSNHPDPDGEYLRMFQEELRPQEWSYVWLDWTCTPQAPRTEAEEKYFYRSLENVSVLIRNCGFVWFYPPWEPRMWILYEIAEYMLTFTGDTYFTDDILIFTTHVREMTQTSVQSVLEKYGYRCKNALDQAFLTSWLELLVLLEQLHVDIDAIRQLLDMLTWFTTTQEIFIGSEAGSVRVHKYDGTLKYKDHVWTFTPFPKWVGDRS